MKKRLVKWLIVLAVVTGAVTTFQFVSNKGKFTKWSHTTVEKGHLEKGNAIYLGYNFRWTGLGKPTIEKVEFIKSDGSIVAKDDEQILIRPFINMSSIGSKKEEDVIKEGDYNNLLPVKGYKVDDNLSLVLHVELVDKDWDQDIKSIRVTYKKFGITQVQTVSFDEGVMTDE